MADEHRAEANASDGARRGYSWLSAIGALVAALCVVVLATVLGSFAAAVFDEITGYGGARSYAPGAHASLAAARLSVFLVSFQVATVALTLLATWPFRRDRASPLALVTIGGGGRLLLGFALALIGLAALYTAVVYHVDRHALLNDLLLFRDVLATDMWWSVALAAVIGAPIAEELVFRGLLYGVLRASPVGPMAAALVTSAVWASVHTQYTVYGVTAIFLIGLYLAWVREATGSVVATIVCHAAYNGAVLMVLLTAPTRFLEAG